MTTALTELAIVDLLDGLRILLVEDEYLIAMDVETICLEHGAADVAIVSRLSDLDDDGLIGSFDDGRDQGTLSPNKAGGKALFGRRSGKRAG
jgi:hypothetical protein